MDAQYWDDRYGSRDMLFSGAPNGVLVAEVSGLKPGRGLDAGAGEGGDALWLAERGWQVTAADISAVALDRAARAAEAHGVADRIQWRQVDLTKESPEVAAYDLVSAQYVPLPRQPEHTALRGLLLAVKPGGTLLFVGHDLADLPPREELGVDPRDFYQPDEVAGLLGPDWTVLIDETRPRTAPAPAGTHHAHDVVLRAQRR
jgi:SAM-dependent methyltransferase